MITAVLEGLGAAAPTQVVTNAELAQRLDTSDAWIRSRTGIAQRHVADAATSTADLAVEAGARAMKSALHGGGAQPDAVIVATTTPDRPIPSTAPEVAGRLGLGTIPAFDVNGVCAGFVYGLATASGLLAAGVAERVLLIGAEVMTRVIDPADRSTAVLFGDGAGAVVLRAGEPGEPGAVGPFDLGSDGDGADLLTVPAGGSRRPVDAAALDERANFLRMDGKEVYRQAVHRMAASSRAVLAKAGLNVDDVDRLVAHQANARIMDAVAARLGVPHGRCIVNVDRYGNTSAASIPLALADGAASGALAAGHRVLLTSFGAGFSWGSALLRWPDVQTA